MSPAVLDQIEQLRIPQIFLKICVLVVGYGKYSRNGQAFVVEMGGHVEECPVFFHGSTDDSDQGLFSFQTEIAAVGAGPGKGFDGFGSFSGEGLV